MCMTVKEMNEANLLVSDESERRQAVIMEDCA